MPESGKKRSASFSKGRYRNLVQYRNLSDDEFEVVWDQLNQGIKKNQSLEIRIQQKLDEFAEDYDLDDLKINDMLALRALALAYITLEDYELYAYNARADGGINLDKIIELEKLNNIMSNLRKDITNLQNDLNITRRVRKGDKDLTVESELDRLRSKAKEFYEQRMYYIFCPKCSNLLFTGWFHYPNDPNNKIQLICNRILDDGNKCNHKLRLSIKDLSKGRGVNIDNVPEVFK